MSGPHQRLSAERVSGGAGSGKTLFGLEFLVRGATQFSEHGVFMSFEESIPDLTKNVASLGFDLDRLVADKKLFVDHVSITPVLEKEGRDGQEDQLPGSGRGRGRPTRC